MQNSPEDFPPELCCPVSLQPFTDPVMVKPSNQTYERSTIMRLMQDAGARGTTALCPLTRMPIRSFEKDLRALAAVNDYRRHHPGVETPQQTTSSTSTQMAHDEALARELERLWMQEDAQMLQAEEKKVEPLRPISPVFRPRQSTQEYKHSPAQQARPSSNSLGSAPAANTFRSQGASDARRRELINDIQNLIYALGFETGPRPRGSIQNDSLLFFAIIERAFLQPLPWQKIKVSEGPKNQAMYQVLKTAIRALNEINLDALHQTEQAHEGQYDRVKTIFHGEISMSKNGGYGAFAKFVGTITNQPGLLVHGILSRVEMCLLHAQRIHNLQQEHESSLGRTAGIL